MTDIFTYMDKLVAETDGLRSIAVADRDGVAVLRAPQAANLQMSDLQSEQILTTIFSLTTDQTTKVKLLGNCRSICLMHDDATVLQGNFGPLVITLNAQRQCHIAELTEVLQDLKEVLSQAKEVIAREIDNW
ncbi:unnamed protein product [Amoebophrya sp. A25]|nr:unnamed protein product [Amoebophrya sp. A25]|eukprot:GSA25T00009733001.1